jgi:hypothetical protein
VKSSATDNTGETVSIFAFAVVVLTAAVGTAFAAGFLIGRMLS